MSVCGFGDKFKKTKYCMKLRTNALDRAHQQPTWTYLHTSTVGGTVSLARVLAHQVVNVVVYVSSDGGREHLGEGDGAAHGGSALGLAVNVVYAY